MKKQCIIIGLGIYGMNVARKLSEEGMEVFAIDKDMRLVERASNFATKAVCMDITNIDAFDGIPVGDFDVGVVGIGDFWRTEFYPVEGLCYFPGTFESFL